MPSRTETRVINLRPKEGYIVFTDIIEQIKKATPKTDIITFVDIDPVMAMDLLTLNIGNRDPTYEDIEKYAKDMGAKPTRWFFLGNTIKITSELRLVDGQKELGAIIHSGITQRFHIQCGLDPKAAYVIDTGRLRSLADALKDAGFTDHNHLAAIIRSVIYITKYRRLGARIKRGQRVDNQTVVSWATKSKDNTDLVYHLLSESRVLRKSAKFLTLTTQAYIWYILHKIDRQDAEYFMNKLFTGEDLQSRLVKDHNINVLRNKLILLDRDPTARLGREREDERLRYIFHTWNATRENIKLGVLSERTVDFGTIEYVKLV